MSEQRKQNPNPVTNELSDQALDSLLSGMAADVPPPSEQFQNSWREAVRQESRRFTPAVPSRKSGKALPSGAGITRFLTAAAMILFLLGGALLARPSLFRFSSPAGSHSVPAAGKYAASPMSEAEEDEEPERFAVGEEPESKMIPDEEEAFDGGVSAEESMEDAASPAESMIPAAHDAVEEADPQTPIQRILGAALILLSLMLFLLLFLWRKKR